MISIIFKYNSTLLLNYLILSFHVSLILHELLFSLIFLHWLINQNKLADKGYINHLYLSDISYQMLKLILNNIQMPCCLFNSLSSLINDIGSIGYLTLSTN